MFTLLHCMDLCYGTSLIRSLRMLCKFSIRVHHHGLFDNRIHLSPTVVRYTSKAQNVFRRVVVLGKLTKYEKLVALEPDGAVGEPLRCAMARKGINVDWLCLRHHAHYQKIAELHDILSSRDIDVYMTKDRECSTDVFDWADCIITAGGDGTFLLGASRLTTRDKPIIGINTDPQYSEGHLCLPKWCTFDLPRAVDIILAGRFVKFWRNRIRVNLYEHNYGDRCVNQTNNVMEQDTETEAGHNSVSAGCGTQECTTGGLVSADHKMTCRRIPAYALNDVFVGEKENARVSQYDISIDGESAERQRSSGVVISTGTGSTAWHYQMRLKSPEDIMKVLELAIYLNTSPLSYQNVFNLLKSLPHSSLPTNVPHDASLNFGDVLAAAKTVETHRSVMKKPSPSTLPVIEYEGEEFSPLRILATQVSEAYNASLRFPPDDLKMAYVIREPLYNLISHIRQPYGFAKSIQIRCNSTDFRLVCDSSRTFPLAYGSVVEFKIFPEDAVCCIRLSASLT